MKYITIEDLPRCKCHGKPQIDPDHLEEYSNELLKEILTEMVRMFDYCRISILGTGIPLCDIEGLKSFEQMTTMIYEQYGEIFKKVKEEYEKRMNPKDFADFTYGLMKLFEEHMKKQKTMFDD